MSPAKVNLFLNILSRDDQGYHDINSIFTHIDLNDEITISESDKFNINFLGEFSKYIKHNNIEILFNFLIKKNLIKSDRYSIRITKNIPVGSGLGGGSSNIATVLNFLKSRKLLRDDEAIYVAKKLGSDIEFFLDNKPAIITGRGNVFRRIEYFKSVYVLLVYPNIVLSTQEVYESYKLSNFKNTFLTKAEKFELDKILGSTKNMLEKTAIDLCPDIKIIIDELKSFYGASYSRMTGSGSCCFTVFNEKDNAIKAKNIIKSNHSSWWTCVARII